MTFRQKSKIIKEQLKISKILINWYLLNQRKLPWRETKDPYRIWISEIILQQTRVEQGLPYYHKFINQFPDIESIATASTDTVMKVWQGLGYYTRAQKMQEAARVILERYHGRLPDSYEGLLKIPGIGPYTAAAIASFAYREAVPVVDGNVIRVLSRLFGLQIDPASSRGKKIFHRKATGIMDIEQPGTFNQAIMEFGATHCLPRNPLCSSCPLRETCYAFTRGKVDALPVKKTRKSSRKRYFHYLVVICNDRVLLQRREKKDIWQSLYEFPLIETWHELDPEELITLPEYQKFSAIIPAGQRAPIPKEDTSSGMRNPADFQYSALYKHVLSHQDIFARFYLIPFWCDRLPDSEGFVAVNLKDIQDYPVPRLIDKFFGESLWDEWKSPYG